MFSKIVNLTVLSLFVLAGNPVSGQLEKEPAAKETEHLDQPTGSPKRQEIQQPLESNPEKAAPGEPSIKKEDTDGHLDDKGLLSEKKDGTSSLTEEQVKNLSLRENDESSTAVEKQVKHLDEEGSASEGEEEHVSLLKRHIKDLKITESKEIDLCDDNDDDIDYVNREREKGKLSSTIPIFSTSRDGSITRDEVLLAVGNQFFREGSYDKALRCYDKMISIKDSVPKYFRNRGLCQTRLANSKKALENFEKAVVLDPNNIRGRFFLGRVYLEFENYAGAVENLELARKFAEDLNALTEEKHLILGLLEKACAKTIELHPDDMKARLLFASTLFEFGKYDQAIDAMTAALQFAERNKTIPDEKENFDNLMEKIREKQESEELARKAYFERKAAEEQERKKAALEMEKNIVARELQHGTLPSELGESIAVVKGKSIVESQESSVDQEALQSRQQKTTENGHN